MPRQGEHGLSARFFCDFSTVPYRVALPRGIQMRETRIGRGRTYAVRPGSRGRARTTNIPRSRMVLFSKRCGYSSGTLGASRRLAPMHPCTKTRSYSFKKVLFYWTRGNCPCDRATRPLNSGPLGIANSCIPLKTFCFLQRDRTYIAHTSRRFVPRRVSKCISLIES